MSTVYMARLVQPAGRQIHGVWVTTSATAAGHVGGESRVAVYATEPGGMKLWSSVPLANVFADTGNYRVRLESEPGVPWPVPAPADDRFVWVAILVAAYTTPPKLLSTAPIVLPGTPGGDAFLKNAMFGMRSRVVQRPTLPPVELVEESTGYGELLDRIIMVTADDWL
ncbi:hypothetical protein [Nonomuraea angiospora]